jgi:hypothetical protein
LLSVNARAFSGDADVLAGKPARNHVNNSAPRSSVKGANVIPNREGREKAVILSGDKYACGVWVALNGANRSPSEQFAAQYSATSAREKSQLIHFSPRCMRGSRPKPPPTHDRPLRGSHPRALLQKFL